MTEAHIADTMKKIDTAGDGVVRKSEFVVWYTASEERIKAETRKLFDQFDVRFVFTSKYPSGLRISTRPLFLRSDQMQTMLTDLSHFNNDPLTHTQE
jgi:hypothetical protein